MRGSLSSREKVGAGSELAMNGTWTNPSGDLESGSLALLYGSTPLKVVLPSMCFNHQRRVSGLTPFMTWCSMHALTPPFGSTSMPCRALARVFIGSKKPLLTLGDMLWALGPPSVPPTTRSARIGLAASLRSSIDGVGVGGPGDDDPRRRLSRRVDGSAEQALVERERLGRVDRDPSEVRVERVQDVVALGGHEHARDG